VSLESSCRVTTRHTPQRLQMQTMATCTAQTTAAAGGDGGGVGMGVQHRGDERDEEDKETISSGELPAVEASSPRKKGQWVDLD